MTIYEFHLLPYNDKVELLYTRGVYIGKRKAPKNIKVLYQLDSFYVEIFYKKYRQFIDHLSYFNSADKLNPYLSQVDVGDIIKYAE
jgi:hypothetical protein